MSLARRILLINPNSSSTTTAMMVDIARAAAPDSYEIAGVTATRAPRMIVDPSALRAAAAEVAEIAVVHSGECDGIIVAAFGDPGLATIRAKGTIPATGIGESAMLAAADGGRRFGVATTTPSLEAEIDALAAGLGLKEQYARSRFTAGDARQLTADAVRLRESLADTVRTCIEQDGAEAVIIGGGPLGQVAVELQAMFEVPIIAPIRAAVLRVIAMMPGAGSHDVKV